MVLAIGALIVFRHLFDCCLACVGMDYCCIRDAEYGLRMKVYFKTGVAAGSHLPSTILLQ